MRSSGFFKTYKKSDPGNGRGFTVASGVFGFLAFFSFRIMFLIFHPLHADTISKTLYLIQTYFTISDWSVIPDFRIFPIRDTILL